MAAADPESTSGGRTSKTSHGLGGAKGSSSALEMSSYSSSEVSESEESWSSRLPIPDGIIPFAYQQELKDFATSTDNYSNLYGFCFDLGEAWQLTRVIIKYLLWGL